MIGVYARAGTFADKHQLAVELAAAVMAVVERLTHIVSGAAGDPSLFARTWMLLTEAPRRGLGLEGHANTNVELVAAARAQIVSLQGGQPAST